MELKGMAMATGLAPLDIYLLSCFEYFSEGRTGCTSLGLSTAEGAFVAQNWDAPVNSTEELVVIVHEDGNGRLITIASAGTLGWVGMNDQGLAFVNNDLILDNRAAGLPSLVVRRMMLAQQNMERALEVLRRHHHMSGRCFLLGEASGRLKVVEVSPSAGVAETAPQVITHTNHPLFPPIAVWEDVEAVARLYPSSRERLRAANRLPLTSIDDIKTMLRDRAGAPDAICKSPSAREPTETAFSVIFDCGRREATIAIGRPDQNPYHRIGLREHITA